MICAEGRSDLGAPAPATILLRPSLGLRRDARSNQPSSRTSPTTGRLDPASLRSTPFRLRPCLPSPSQPGISYACIPLRYGLPFKTAPNDARRLAELPLDRAEAVEAYSTTAIALGVPPQVVPPRPQSPDQARLHPFQLPPFHFRSSPSLDFADSAQRPASARSTLVLEPGGDAPRDARRARPLRVDGLPDTKPRRIGTRRRCAWHEGPASRYDSRSKYSLRVWAAGLAPIPSKHNETLCSKPPFSVATLKGNPSTEREPAASRLPHHPSSGPVH
jgi:hypothetical protein